MMIKRYSHLVFSLILLCFSALVSAQETPQQMVQVTVDKLINDLNTNRATYKQNPEAFHTALHKILSPVVDTDGIARSVMTIKYTRRATPAQMKAFIVNFEKGLMQFYGNALLEYENKGIRVLRETPTDSPDRVSVAMEIKGDKNVVYPVSYTIVKLNGKWMVRNVIVNGLNVGKLFRDQFASEMKTYDDNLDFVIDNWAEAVKRAQQSADD